MTIVDTHRHTGLDKYEPVESLLFHMEQSGVEKAVLIQRMGTTDNSYHVECLRQYPHRSSQPRSWKITTTAAVSGNGRIRGSTASACRRIPVRLHRTPWHTGVPPQSCI